MISRILGRSCGVLLSAGLFLHGVEAAPSPETNGPTNTTPTRVSFEEISRLAVEGNADAQNYLGDCSVYGIESQTQDFTNAVRWYRKAAVQGHAMAQFNLGLLYETGKGVATQYSKALEWYGKAAAAGQPDAQAGLGMMYLKGLGVVRDVFKAREWFEKAAAVTNAEAAYQLGVMERDGVAGGRNGISSYRWFFEAARKNHAEAMAALGLALLKSDAPQSEWGKAEDWLRGAATQDVAQAQYALAELVARAARGPGPAPEAIQWYRRSAELNHLPSQIRLAEILRRDHSSPTNAVESALWYRIAAESGDAEAQTWVGINYLEGKGVPKVRSEALRWFRMAAEKGYAKAQFRLAQLLQAGEGGVSEVPSASVWMQRAADQGFAPAQFEVFLGMQPTNSAGALVWLQRSAEGGWADAQYSRGREYERSSNGGREEPESKEAVRWYRAAAEQGHSKAQTALARVLLQSAQRDARASLEARSWLEKSAQSGDPEAMFRLGLNFADGSGSSREWMRRAAEFQYGPAARQWGLAHLTSEGGLEHSPDMGASWLEKAVAWEDYEAAYDLGLLYWEGVGVKQDRNEALKLFRLASRHGSERARLHWMQLYQDRQGRVSLRESIYWLRLAEESGSALAAIERAKLKAGVPAAEWDRAESELQSASLVRELLR